VTRSGLNTLYKFSINTIKCITIYYAVLSVCRLSSAPDIDSPTSPTVNDETKVVDEPMCAPDCWSYDQCFYFKTENDWLCITNKMLKCTVCADVKSLNCYKTQGIDLSPEWIAGTVSYNGDTRTKQQTSLRKKISLHKKSKGHKRALLVLKDAKSGVLSQSISKQQRSLNITSERVFRTAYKQVKLNRPFLDFETEIEVQVLNGIDMGRILHSNVACRDIAVHICTEMRKSVCSAIVERKSKFAVMIDESTTISKLTTLIIYIRTTFDETGPITMFLDLVELQSTTAECIVTALLSSLKTHGMSDDFIRDNCVGLATDGASVMLGKKAGVAKLITDKYPDIITWHCIAHRLELGVHDTIEEVSGTNNFKIFLDSLYALYSMSPKNKGELSVCAAELEVELLTIGRVLDTRWVASSLRTVRAVWQSFPALYSHFKLASTDALREGRERSKYSGLAKRLSSKQFVQNLGLMFDALTELADLSLEVQKRSITLPVAHRAIGRQVAVFEAMCCNSGPRLQEADNALTLSLFKGVPLHNGSKCDVLIKREQFFRSLANNMKNRLLTVQSSHVSVSDNADAIRYETLINQLKVLCPDNWPDELASSSCTLYGEDDVMSLAQRFKVDVRRSVRAFRDYRDKGGKRIPDELKPLMTAIDTVPVCTAECERGFSQMNLIMSPTRNSLKVDTVAHLLFGKLVGPPLASFNPSRYVQSWLAKGRHSADDTNSKCKTKQSTADSVYRPVWHLL